jgi:hypothetical protein
VISKTKVKGKVWVQMDLGWVAVRDPKSGKEMLKSRAAQIKELQGR